MVEMVNTFIQQEWDFHFPSNYWYGWTSQQPIMKLVYGKNGAGEKFPQIKVNGWSKMATTEKY